jgi:lactoylglutathione lyase
VAVNARIEHVAIWTRDIEVMRAFYSEALGGASGRLYENRVTGFKSYFMSFGDGPRLELMHQPGRAPSSTASGSGHIALALGSRAAVDEAIASLRQRGVSVESDPRVTGDGYYEAVVLDPERNRIELTA